MRNLRGWCSVAGFLKFNLNWSSHLYSEAALCWSCFNICDFRALGV